MGITHPFVDLIADDPAQSTRVRPSNWNAAHAISGNTGEIFFSNGASDIVSAPNLTFDAGTGAPAFRSSSITTYASRTNTTLTAPAGIQSGDALVIFFSVGGASPVTPTAPAGFTLAAGFPGSHVGGGGFTVNDYLWTKTAASEAGNYTVTHATGSTQGYMMAVSNASATPSPASTLNERNSGDVPAYSPTIATGLTTAVDNCLVAFVSSDFGDTANALTGPTGSTPTFTTRATSGLLYVATGVLASAGATGNKSITNNNTGDGSAYGGYLISFPPSATGTLMTETVDAVAGLFSASVLTPLVGPGGASSLTLDGTPKLTQVASGAGTAALGIANCPASTLSAPYRWLTMKAEDGSTVYVPAWK